MDTSPSSPLTQDDSKKVKTKHCKWNKQDDLMLCYYVSLSHNTPNWKLISKNFKNRNPRQCQERWEYYLSPDVNNGPWTAEEDALLYQKYAEYGSQWKVISSFFKGRTNTNVKNRFLYLERKKSAPPKADNFSVKQPNAVQCLSFTPIEQKNQPLVSSNDTVKSGMMNENTSLVTNGSEFGSLDNLSFESNSFLNFTCPNFGESGANLLDSMWY